MASTLIAIADALDLLTSAATTIATIAPIVKQAQAEGRTTLTPAEWATITGGADAADEQFDSDLTKGT